MITLAFFAGYITSSAQQTTTPTPMVPTPTSLLNNNQYPDAWSQERYGLKPERFDSRAAFNNSGKTYSDNSNTNITIGEFFSSIDYDKVTGKIKEETEIGKTLINKYGAEAEKGNEQHILYMALTYRIYLHDERNEIVWLDKLVTKNNDYAMMRRGDLFEDAKDINSSITLYEKAVALGNSTAMVGLAEKYIIHVRGEINKPVELLATAAAKNNIEACMELANLYSGMYGKQYPLDHSKAMNLYLQYLQLSDGGQTNSDILAWRSAAMKTIAMLYKNGNGVTKNNAAYRLWMKKEKAEQEKYKGIL